MTTTATPSTTTTSGSGSNKYPNTADAYELVEEIGLGTHTSVWKALCKPLNSYVAIKKIDLEKYPNVLEDLRKEIQVMKTSNHSNIVTYLTSFVNDTNLYLVMELLEGGSIYDIMRYKFPYGIESEELIATILKQVLLGLEYFHKNGQIHRDVKAGNILVSIDGRIRIGDFGVSAHLIESGDRKKVRQTFVGTPCWMAPEVMEQLHGYDYKADIWSFGITAIELATGRAPFSDYEPIKVMYLILENPPPKLDDHLVDDNIKFSKTFKELIELCLQKDPAKRPTSTLLLKHKFFQKAKQDPAFIYDRLIRGVPSLGDRIRHYKLQMEEEERRYKQERIRLQEQYNDKILSSPPTITHNSNSNSNSNNSSNHKRTSSRVAFAEDVIDKSFQQFHFDEDQMIEQREGNLLDINMDDGKPNSGWDWEEKLNIVRSTPNPTTINHESTTTTTTTTKPLSPSSPPTVSHMRPSTSNTNIAGSASSKTTLTESGRKIEITEISNVTYVASDDDFSDNESSSSTPYTLPTIHHGNATNTTSNNTTATTTPSVQVTRKFEVKDVEAVTPVRKIEIKDVEPSEVPKTNKDNSISTNNSSSTSLTASTSIDEKMRQKSFSKSSTTSRAEPTLQSIQTQISQLNQANQQQLKILNALFSMAQTPSTTGTAVFQSKYKENSSELPALISQLEYRIKDLLEENIKLKKENEILKSDLSKVKSTNGIQQQPATSITDHSSTGSSNSHSPINQKD